MIRQIIISFLVFTSINVHAQIDKQYIYNSWQDTNQYYGDTLSYNSLSTLYTHGELSKDNLEYANKIIRVVQFTTDNRMLDFNLNMTTHDTVKWNLRATWKWNDDPIDPRLMINGAGQQIAMSFELHIITIQKDKLVLKINGN